MRNVSAEKPGCNARLKVISGGQTGVDRAALEWAVGHGVPHGGWCPKGRKAEDGVIPPQFHLVETQSEEYPVRTRLNIRDSDATVIFSERHELSGGTRETFEMAHEMGKPLLHLLSATTVQEAAARLRSFIDANRVKVLNVAGPRASQAPHVGEFVKAVLSRAVATWR